MNNIQKKTFQNATGKIDYTLMNDYMFRAVLQQNENVLKGLISSLLHLNPETIKSTTILNPIELGKVYDEKTFVLDIKVMLNDATIINIEMQIANQEFWTNRSLSYLCSIFQNLESGESYAQVKPAYHIGILNFSPFPDYPELFATNKMVNIKNNYIYNDNFTLNVLDLTQIHLATEEDKAYKIDYWAKLFKAKTWEDLRMLAQNDNVIEETCETVYKLNQDKEVRYLCEMREEGQRILRTYEYLLKEKDDALAKSAATIAENTATIAENTATIAALQDQIKALQNQVDSLTKQV